MITFTLIYLLLNVLISYIWTTHNEGKYSKLCYIFNIVMILFVGSIVVAYKIARKEKS